MLPKIVVKRCLIVMQMQSYTKGNVYGAKPQDILFLGQLCWWHIGYF